MSEPTHQRAHTGEWAGASHAGRCYWPKGAPLEESKKARLYLDRLIASTTAKPAGDAS
jgi:hypothetical protein